MLGNWIGHRFAGEVVFALQITCLVKEFQNVADIIHKRRGAPLGLNIAKNTDLRSTVGKNERVGKISYHDWSYRNGRGSCKDP